MHRLFLAVIMLFASAGIALAMSGKVVGVVDGDTLDVLTGNNVKQRVRLASIDAPERKQPFGTVSKQKLSSLVFGKQVDVTEDRLDRYGRLIGIVTADGINVNKEMVAEGMAWVYPKYLNQSRDTVFLLRQAYAKEEKKGLWKDDSPIPPWEFRKPKASR